MTTFTVRGTRNGSLVHVTWSDGRLTGDPPTVDLLLTEAEIVASIHHDDYAAKVYPELRALPTEPLAAPGAAYLLIAHVLDNIRETTGDVPTRERGQTAPA